MAQELQLAEKKKKSSSEEGQGILILRRYRKPKVDQPIRTLQNITRRKIAMETDRDKEESSYHTESNREQPQKSIGTR